MSARDDQNNSATLRRGNKRPLKQDTRAVITTSEQAASSGSGQAGRVASLPEGSAAKRRKTSKGKIPATVAEAHNETVA